MKNKGSRLPTDPQVDAVIELLLSGVPLRQAVSQCGFTPRTFNRRLCADRDAALAYSRAQEFKADLLADEIIDIADTSEDAAKARNQIESRKWVASKYNSKRFGDRIDLNVTQTIDIGSTLEEARGRYLRPMRDPAQIIEAQAIELPSINAPRPSDKELEKPEPITGEPDIFS